MKFLIDAQLPPGLCGWLRERDHEVSHVFDLDMAGAADSVIAAYAETEQAILVSKDEDFVTLRLPDRFALLWLRCGNATNQALIAWRDARWDRIAALLTKSERFIEVR